jgi:hypothetical protein
MPASATTTKSGVGSLALCAAPAYVEMQIAKTSPDKETAKRLLMGDPMALLEWPNVSSSVVGTAGE